MTENEVWKDVVEYEGLYEVSDKGNVRSVARKDSIGRKCGGRVLKPINNGHGYLQVDMCKNGKAKKNASIDWWQKRLSLTRKAF